MPNEVARAMYLEAQIEMTEAKRRTPVETGALKASGEVLTPVVRGREIEVVLGFGDASVDYATIVHEDLEAFHPIGQAKFLESTINESVPFMASRIGKRLNLEGLVD